MHRAAAPGLPSSAVKKRLSMSSTAWYFGSAVTSIGPLLSAASLLDPQILHRQRCRRVLHRQHHAELGPFR